ncbi:MAG: ATP-binding protein [Candidatus Cloacimonetes bacterium]|nr:ATP-binding protein [Candidatus Cloacimonadota bacterium]
MKKIKKIEINNFKGLYGKYEIDLASSGRNLMLYGENGSGKSSVAKAIKLFFQSSVENIDILEYENIFIPETDQNNGYIKLIIGDKGNSHSNNPYLLDNSNNKQIETYIKNANKIKGFLDYKSLLKTHYLNTKKVNIFELLIEDLLTEFINPRTENTIISDWEELKRKGNDKRTLEYKAIKQKDGLLSKFNDGVRELLNEIEIKTNEIIKYFYYDLTIKLHYNNVTIGKEKGFANKTIYLQVDFFKKNIPEHHNFLNEARLTAISISIYLGAILGNISTDFQLLVLDDVFIGLDTSNRLPFLKILDDKFSDYQIFMTTYDKSWYELVKSENSSNWKFAEMYVKKEPLKQFEIPVIHHKTDFVDMAEYYLDEKADFKASAVYIRSEFEKILKDFCHKNKIAVKYCKNQSKISSNEFWLAIKDDTKRDGSRYITVELRNNIERQRTLVMNPFSHHDNKPQFRAELRATIDYVKELKNTLG